MTEVPLHLLPYPDEVALDLIDTPTYQRPIEMREAWVRRTVSRFDPRKLGVVWLALKDDDSGRYWVIDGLGRITVLRRLGWAGTPALVHVGLSHEEQALLYEGQDDRKALTAYDRHRSRVDRGDPDALSLQRTLAEHGGFRLTHTGGTRHARSISAVDAMVRMQKDGGDRLVARVCDFIAWWTLPDDEGVSGAILNGLAYFLTHAQGPLDEEQLRRKVGVNSPRQVENAATANQRGAGGGKSPKYVALVLAELYNKGRRTQKVTLR